MESYSFKNRKEILKMNGKRWMLMVLLVMTAILLTAAPAAAKATRTEFKGTDIWVEDISPGKEWVTDGIDHVRGAQSRFALMVDDPRVSGDNTPTCNWNFKIVDPPVYVAGPMWGTFQIINGGGYWKGVWTGVRDEQGFSHIVYIGSGGGGYAGLHLRLFIERLNPDPTTPETVTGYILDPGK
jgi:hypothetical protein